jgi:hypothetical protein
MRARFEWTPWSALAALATLVAAPAGCDDPATRPRPVLLTLADLEEAATNRPDQPLFPESGVPGGLPLGDYVTRDAAGNFHLTLRDTWTEGYRSGYVTTELWSGFDEVWVQPMYVPITGFEGGKPVRVKGDDGVWHPIFSVGPDSAFYSPFWQIVYVQVPAGTPATAYTSARAVIDSGLPLIPARGQTIALIPGAVVLPQATETSSTVPGSDREIGTPKSGKGYLAGEPVDFLDFGEETFRWNEERVVEEIPLFVLLWRRPDGTLERLNVPTVAGTGPLYANRPIEVSDLQRPRYGAYWRVYTVELPPGARVFAPPLFTDFVAGLPADLPLATYAPELAEEKDLTFLDDWLGRVALNALPVDGRPHGCFGSYDFLTGDDQSYACQWLDSQPAIEKAVVPEAIKKTDLVVTCPFVTYHDKAVLP